MTARTFLRKLRGPGDINLLFLAVAISISYALSTQEMLQAERTGFIAVLVILTVLAIYFFFSFS